MRSSVIVGHTKWPHTIESDFRSSKLAAGGHFVNLKKTTKLHIDMKWREMRSKVIFGHPKWPPVPFC